MTAASTRDQWMRRLFWLLAAVVLPLLNPVIVYYGSEPLGTKAAPGILILVAAIADFAALSAVARRAWADLGTQRRRRAAGMFAAIVLSIPAIYVDIFIVLWIASLSCPPNAYECPV